MDSLLILALESATGCASVALTRGGLRQGRILAEYAHFPEKIASRQLLGMAQELMRSCALDWQELDAVAVSCGPGSFTGLRIGMAAGQGLSFAAGKPLITVPTLDAIAASLPAVDWPVCALLDARKGQVYAAFYSLAERDAAGLPQRLGPYRVCAPEALLAELHEPVLCAGPGLAACGTDFLHHPLVRIAPPATGQPRAALVGLCAADRMRAALPAESGLLYVRSSEKELDLKRPEPC